MRILDLGLAAAGARNSATSADASSPSSASSASGSVCRLVSVDHAPGAECGDGRVRVGGSDGWPSGACRARQDVGHS